MFLGLKYESFEIRSRVSKSVAGDNEEITFPQSISLIYNMGLCEKFMRKNIEMFVKLLCVKLAFESLIDAGE